MDLFDKWTDDYLTDISFKQANEKLTKIIYDICIKSGVDPLYIWDHHMELYDNFDKHYYTNDSYLWYGHDDEVFMVGGELFESGGYNHIIDQYLTYRYDTIPIIVGHLYEHDGDIEKGVIDNHLITLFKGVERLLKINKLKNEIRIR